MFDEVSSVVIEVSESFFSFFKNRKNTSKHNKKQQKTTKNRRLLFYLHLLVHCFKKLYSRLLLFYL